MMQPLWCGADQRPRAGRVALRKVNHALELTESWTHSGHEPDSLRATSYGIGNRDADDQSKGPPFAGHQIGSSGSQARMVRPRPARRPGRDAHVARTVEN